MSACLAAYIAIKKYVFECEVMFVEESEQVELLLLIHLVIFLRARPFLDPWHRGIV
jgi:hypothetical protein